MPLAAAAPEPGRIEIREVEAAVPGEGQVVVRVSHCGVCGTDLHFFHGRMPVPPVCPGHEISAVVEAAGAGVRGLKQGDRVAVEPIRRCRSCELCRRGDYHLCDQLALFGVHAPGGMAEQMLVPAYCLHPLPPSVDLRLGALCEPLAVAVHAARLAGLGAGSSALVLGAGSIGLLATLVCKHLGADFVAVTARYPQQAERARALGADQVLAPEEVGRCERAPQVAIETVGGASSTVADALGVLARGGCIAVAGLFDRAPEFPPLLLTVKEARIVGSMVYNRRDGRTDFEIALEILAEHARVLAPLVTHTFPLDRAQRAFETAADKATGALKVMIAPGAQT